MGGPLAGASAALLTKLNVYALPGCSNSTELQDAINYVRYQEDYIAGERARMDEVERSFLKRIEEWNAWAAAKEREAEQYWLVDPRRGLIGTEVNIARADQATREIGLQRVRAQHAVEMAGHDIEKQRRQIVVWAIENKRTWATSHDGYCD